MNDPSPLITQRVAGSCLYISGGYERIIVVGDIHGCIAEFRLLLEEVRFTAKDILVSVGDIVDRGPGTWDVAHFFREKPNVFSVLGNHERRLAGVIRGTSQAAWSQLQSLGALPSPEHERWAAWFDTLPAVISTPHVIITHARLDPAMGMAEQVPYHTCAVGGDRVNIELDENGVPLWFHGWRAVHAAGLPVAMGHISYCRIDLVPGQLYALDTAAVRGGALTAVVFPGGVLSSIPSKSNYYQAALDAWRGEQRLDRPVSEIPVEWFLHPERIPAGESVRTEIESHIATFVKTLVCDKRLETIRARLAARIGTVPPPGPARGEYFKALGAKVSPEVHSHLVKSILRGDKGIHDLAKLFEGKKLGELSSSLDAIEAWLDEGIFRS